MPIKKSELYSSLWSSCDQLRGGMDASQYKDYVLVLLFVKYVSDKYADEPYAPIVIPEGGGFEAMVDLKGNKNIGDEINKIIGELAQKNNLKGVIDVADFNDPNKLGQGKEMVDRLTNLVAIFENPALDFSQNRVEGDDIMGDAYEYLMRHFATQSGKSKGQFYTPAEVSRVIAQVIRIEEAESQTQTIYDPACGSGSLLLKAEARAPEGVTIYGQEIDNSTAALAKMNMILHDNPTAEIWQDNSLARPHWKNGNQLKTFDYVVANPPFSYKAWRNVFDPENDLYGRFEYGIPPKSNGDYAFLLHILSSMKSDGQGAVILPHGVLFRGNVEADIRRNLVRRGFIKGIIGLPPNLFYGTGIPASIIVLDKEHADERDAIFMIDASGGFKKDGNKNRLRHQDIRKIVDVFNEQVEIYKYSRLVSLKEIEEDDFNLNLPRYIDTTESEDIHDIEAHLKGGIPERDIDDLDKYWQVFTDLKGDLFEDNSRPGYSELKLSSDEVKDFIKNHPEFKEFQSKVKGIFEEWKSKHRLELRELDPDVSPKDLIKKLSRNLLQSYASIRLIDKYDIYQQLMSYWTETMQDDVYMILEEGWLGANKLRLLKGESKESADLKIRKMKYKADLIPPELIIDRYFSEEKEKIEKLEAEEAEITRQREEIEEEHGGEEGLLSEAMSDAGNVTKGAANARYRKIEGDPEYTEELEVLEPYVELRDQETKAGRAVRKAQERLEEKVVEKIDHLSEQEIREIVIEYKWFQTLEDGVQTELDQVSRILTSRVKELAERYETPLPELEKDVTESRNRVRSHLARMGFPWK